MFHTLDLIRITPAGAPPLSCNCNLRRQSCRGRIRDGTPLPSLPGLWQQPGSPPTQEKPHWTPPRCLKAPCGALGFFKQTPKKAAEVRESRREEGGGGGASEATVKPGSFLPQGPPAGWVTQVGAGRANLLWSSTTLTQVIKWDISPPVADISDTTLCFLVSTMLLLYFLLGLL